MELAAAGEDMKKLREIARTHIEKAAAGDMQAIKEPIQYRAQIAGRALFGGGRAVSSFVLWCC
jgi:hypothetical protein